MVWVISVLFMGVFFWGGGGVGGGGSTDSERINHMTFCWSQAGHQMGQNYDGLLIKVLNVRR